MKPYKRILSMLLLLAIALTLFAACGKEEETASQGEVSDMSGEQHFNIGDIMSNSASSSSSETVSSEPSQGDTSEQSGTTETPSTDEPHDWSGEFIITEKKYEYKEKNFMLLNVTNDTGKNCNLTITGTFYDEAGEVVRVQQQLYHNHPTGWSNYFIFYPDMKFDSFTYEASAEEYENNTPLDSMFSYNGQPLSDFVAVSWIPGFFWVDDPDGNKLLMYRMKSNCTHPECEMKIFGHQLILDENGDVFALDFADTFDGDITKVTQIATWPHIEEDPDFAFMNQALRRVSEDSAEYAKPLPDGENFTFIFAIQAVVDYNVWYDLAIDATVSLEEIIPPKNFK